MSHHVGQGEKKGMAETCLPFQCRALETQIKKRIQKLKERVQPDKRKEKGEKEEKRKKEEGETVGEDLA